MKKINEVIDMSGSIGELKRSFMDACSNKMFSDYVYNLAIKEDILIKYTSSLQDSFSEKQNCVSCDGISSCKNKVAGYCYTPSSDNKRILFSYVACPFEIANVSTSGFLKNITFLNMSKEIKRASFANIFTEDKKRLLIIKYFQKFIKKYLENDSINGLYLSGSFGSGKTYMISALFNELANKDVKSVMVYYPELLRNLKESFKDNYKELFYLVKTAPLLLLDDIGAENVTPWGRDEVLGPILQYRMEEKLPTFFTSNLTIEQLENHLSTSSNAVDKVKARRIVERIKCLTEHLELISDNRRGK